MTEAAAPPFPRRGALLFAAGLVILVLALFTLNLTSRTLFFWWYQADLVRTELVITDLSDRQYDPLLFGTVAATGEEVHTSIFPTEIFQYDSPRDATGTLKRPDQVRGLHIPIWYGSARDSLVGTPTIYYVSEYGTPPSTRLALLTTAINAAIGWLGVLCIRWGLRTRHRRGGEDGRRAARRARG